MGALRLARLSLGQRLLLALAAMLLPLVAVGVIGLLSLHAADQDVERVTGRYAAESRAITAARADLERAESSVRHETPGPNRRTGWRLDDWARRLNRRFDELERFDTDAERQLARRSRRHWRRAYALVTGGADGSNRSTRRSWEALQSRFHRRIDAAHDSIDSLSETARRNTVAATAAVDSREQRIFAAFLAIFALGAGPASLIGWRIHRSINRPAERLRAAAERVGGGDHHHRVSLERGDELAEVASAFNAMVEKVAASEEMLRRATKQDAIGQLASGIAHDFNNLLVVMLNSAHFVQAALPYGDPAQEDVKEIRRAAERATALTRQLLSFSRPMDTGREVLDLSAVLRDMQPLLARSLGEHIELVISAGDHLPPVQGDPAHLEQIVLNLALNARDAMPDGGRLEITTERATSSSSADTAARVRLIVRDSGCGMTSETAARALEPLFTTKPPGEGTGLGLATVDRIVRGMQGRIELSTGPGSGTVVTVELPATQAAPRRAPVPGRDGRSVHGETILLVEDDDEVRGLVQRILVDAGYVVLAATHPKQALQLASQHREDIDLVLSDVVMPVYSGPAMVERMKRFLPHINVLYLSGYPDSVLAVRRIRMHGFPLVEKPFDPDTLTRRVRDALAAPKEAMSPARS